MIDLLNWSILKFLASGNKTISLRGRFKNDFYVGTTLNDDQVRGKDRSALDLCQSHFNSITPENCLKWSDIQKDQDAYHFDPADRFVAYGEQTGMFMVGHTLVWHEQTPDWVFVDDSGHPVTREILLRRMRDYIFAVVGRYKGRIQAWDVVNEAVADDGQMRRSSWFQIIGEDYVQKAFEFAREADPDAKLYYNDYSLYFPRKRDGVVELVRNLQSSGIQIDGVGIQGHWGLDFPESLAEIEASIQAFADLGVEVMITELDVTVLPMPDDRIGADISKHYDLSDDMNPYPDRLPDSVQQKLANRYAEYFSLFRKHRNQISRVTIWGIHDGQSWLNHWPIEGRTNYPLLFDRDLNPKPAFEAVCKTAEDEICINCPSC